MQNNRTALYVTTRLFWPPDSGRKVTLYHYCKGMSERLGYEVHVYSFLEGDQTPEMTGKKPSFISSVTTAKPVGVFDKACNVAKAAVDSFMPLQCCLFMSKGNQRALKELVDKIAPDVILIDMVRLAPYMHCLSNEDSAVVINYDDLLSKRYVRQRGETNGNILGKFSVSASSALTGIVNGRLKDSILKIEARRVEKAEDKYAKQADACLFVSPIEAAELDFRIAEKKCFSATMGAEVGVFGDCQLEPEFEFGFVGNMHTSANQDSLRYLVDKVLPLLPGKKLCVIGVCPDEIRQEYKDRHDIEFTGRVSSVDEHLKRCKMLLAPFAYGTGIKTKVLEAMGAGVPVVTNAIGLEGIAAREGIDVLSADTPEGLAKAAESILKDGKLRNQIALSGYEYVKENHSWEKSINDLGKCLDYAISEHSKGGC